MEGRFFCAGLEWYFILSSARVSTGFCRVLLGFTGFYWVLLGSTGFYWVLLGFTGFNWLLLSFTGLNLVLLASTGFCWNCTGFYWVLLGFTGFYWVLLGFTGFYCVLPSFTGFYWLLLGFTKFLLAFIWFHQVLLGFTRFSGFIHTKLAFYYRVSYNIFFESNFFCGGQLFQTQFILLLLNTFLNHFLVPLIVARSGLKFFGAFRSAGNYFHGYLFWSDYLHVGFGPPRKYSPVFLSHSFDIHFTSFYIFFTFFLRIREAYNEKVDGLDGGFLRRFPFAEFFSFLRSFSSLLFFLSLL